MVAKKNKVITPADILAWRRFEAPVIRVRTARDALPSGLAMAMAPLLVNWTSSSAGFGPDDYYILNNVNLANNPVGGITLLGGLKVFADSVESVEFVMVISKVARVETQAGHGMLRFNFRKDRRPIILDKGGEPLANDSAVEDIVVSWEAWRPPTASFDALAGLDPKTYALSPRCFVGSVRCLTDAVLDRPWTCYPLRLPDVDNSLNELLYVSLALADAVARQTIMNILDQRIEKTKDMPDDYQDADLSEWEQVAEYYRNTEVPEGPIRDILDGKIRYHLLERSCITMALSSVDWANRRIHERAGLGEPKPLRVAPLAMPSFMSKLASGKRTAVLLRVPAALHWVLTNQTVIPAKAYELLDEVGLLQRENGRIKKVHYDNRRHTPYGEVAEHLIY